MRFLKTTLLACSFFIFNNGANASLIPNQQASKEQQEDKMQWQGYMQLGLTWLTPTVGLGFRGDKNNKGIDIGLDFTTPFDPKTLTILKLNLNYLKYFNVREKSRWYFGSGISYAYLHIDFNHQTIGYVKGDLWTIYPIQLTIGKEKSHKSGRKTFLQAQLATIGYIHNIDNWAGPLLSVTYGFLF